MYFLQLALNAWIVSIYLCFKNDLFDGKGRYTYKNGSYWEGNFLRGERNGVGISVDKRPELKTEKKKKRRSK